MYTHWGLLNVAEAARSGGRWSDVGSQDLLWGCSGTPYSFWPGCHHCPELWLLPSKAAVVFGLVAELYSLSVSCPPQLMAVDLQQARLPEGTTLVVLTGTE